MNKDYLTSPFNDEFMKNLKVATDAIQKSTDMRKSLEPMLTNLGSIRELHSTYIAENLKQSINLMKELPVYRPSESVIQIFKDITVTLKEAGYFEIDGDIESVIKEKEVYSKENENKETPKTIIYSHDLDSWKQYQDNKYRLDSAFFNYKVALQRFNEVFHKSYSYVSERKMAVWGLSNAISTVIALLVSINPILPIAIFSSISVFGLFEPKDK